MTADGQQTCECAHCYRVGTVFVRKFEKDTSVDGFVCLGGPLMPSGRLRAMCSGCTRKAVAAFARVARAKLLPDKGKGA